MELVHSFDKSLLRACHSPSTVADARGAVVRKTNVVLTLRKHKVRSGVGKRRQILINNVTNRYIMTNRDECTD